MNPRRILLVDDEESIRKLVSVYFRRRGYLVETASDGIEALEIISHGCPDLVLSDVNMPRLDGVDLVRRLREDTSTASLPIILFSAQSHAVPAGGDAPGGANAFISKPLDLSLLIRHVEALIANRPSANEDS